MESLLVPHRERARDQPDSTVVLTIYLHLDLSSQIEMGQPDPSLHSLNKMTPKI